MKFREQRRFLGVGQRELARRMGTTPNTISRWERDEPPITGPAKKLIELLVQIRQLADDMNQSNKGADDEHHT